MNHAQIKRQGLLFCLVGPTGGGKTTLATRLCEEYSGSIKLSVSATSRPPRSGEKEGASYIFLSRADFEKKIEQGKFFEWAEVHGSLYGTLQHTVTDTIGSGTDLLLDIDLQGVLQFKEKFSNNTVVTFLVPPSPQALRERVQARSKVSEEELARRLNTVQSEYATVHELFKKPGTIDYFVVNDKIDKTYNAVAAILRAERARFQRLDSETVAKLCKVE